MSDDRLRKVLRFSLQIRPLISDYPYPLFSLGSTSNPNHVVGQDMRMNYIHDVLITVRDAASRLGVREGTTRVWLTQRRLPRVNCGRAVRIPSKAVEDFVRQNAVPAKDRPRDP
jgi:excisionase family DNA binding protein